MDCRIIWLLGFTAYITLGFTLEHWRISSAMLSLVGVPVMRNARLELAPEHVARIRLFALAGLAVNAVWQIHWADPVAALALTPLILREGWEAIQGKACGCS